MAIRTSPPSHTPIDDSGLIKSITYAKQMAAMDPNPERFHRRKGRRRKREAHLTSNTLVVSSPN